MDIQYEAEQNAMEDSYSAFAKLMAQAESRMHRQYDHISNQMIQDRREVDSQLFGLEDRMGVVQSEPGVPGIEPDEDPVRITNVRWNDGQWQYKAVAVTYKKGVAYSETDVDDGDWITPPDQPAFTPAGVEAGDMLFWDGEDWVVLSHGSEDDVLQINASGQPAWQSQHVEKGTQDNELLYWDDTEQRWKPFVCGSTQIMGWLNGSGEAAQVLMANGSPGGTELDPSFQYITPLSMQDVAAAGGPQDQMQAMVSGSSPDGGATFPVGWRGVLPTVPGFNPAANNGALLRWSDTGNDGGAYTWSYITPFEIQNTTPTFYPAMMVWPDNQLSRSQVKSVDEVLRLLPGVAVGKVLQVTDAGGGYQSARWVDPSDIIVSLPAGTKGQILYHNGTDWVVLAVGTDGKVLTTHGAEQNPTWEDGGGALPDASGKQAGMVLQLTTAGDEDSATWDWLRVH